MRTKASIFGIHAVRKGGKSLMKLLCNYCDISNHYKVSVLFFWNDIVAYQPGRTRLEA